MSAALANWQRNATLAASIVQIGRRVLWERLVDPRPTNPRVVPPSTEAMMVQCGTLDSVALLIN
jgi:hypothetical protein